MKKITLKLTCFTLLVCLSSVLSFAQQPEKCATDAITQAQRQKNPVRFDQNRAQLEAYVKNYVENNASSRSTNAITKIPTVIHVIHNGEAVGTYPNMSEVQLLSAITDLNDAFKNQGIYAGSAFYNNPMDIEFVLAKVKVDGTTTTGIERHNVTGKPYAAVYNSDGINGAPGTPGADSAILFKDYFWNPQDYMNIWVVKKIEGVDVGLTGNGTLGYATFPTTFTGSSDGLVCQARAFGYNPAYDSSNPGATPGFDFGSSTAPSSGNGTADHEVGHYLNLQHTFTGDNNGADCPADLVVGVNSDGCADIPPHKRTNSICPADSTSGNTCTGGHNNYIHNFMDYSSDNCFTGFSGDQRTRVNAAIDGPRAAFKTAIGHSTPTITTFPAAVTNVPTVTNQNGSDLGIFEVTLNGTTYKSISAYNDGFYLNRVASQPTTTLVANTSYTMTVKVGVGNTIDNELVDIYIDYDNNGAFNTTNERIFQSAGGTGKNNGDNFTINFTTPATGGFVNGQKLRMRVISGFDNGVDTLANSYTSDIGNIEDYSVVFNPVLAVAYNEINTNDIKIYPNPTNNILNISNATNNELTSITIFDTLGKQVFKGSNSDKVNVGNLENGMYFLKLEFNDNSVITKRFIKQ